MAALFNPPVNTLVESAKTALKRAVGRAGKEGHEHEASKG
jgi:hypothetical protein